MPFIKIQLANFKNDENDILQNIYIVNLTNNPEQKEIIYSQVWIEVDFPDTSYEISKPIEKQKIDRMDFINKIIKQIRSTSRCKILITTAEKEYFFDLKTIDYVKNHKIVKSIAKEYTKQKNQLIDILKKNFYVYKIEF